MLPPSQSKKGCLKGEWCRAPWWLARVDARTGVGTARPHRLFDNIENAGMSRPRPDFRTCLNRRWWLAGLIGLWLAAVKLAAAEPVIGPAAGYEVQAYAIEGKSPIAPPLLLPLLAKHTGTNVSLNEIVQAALDLQQEYGRQGHPSMNIGLAPDRMTNGVLVLNVFEEPVAQIFVSGKGYQISHNVLVPLAPPLTGRPPPADELAADKAPPAKAGTAKPELHFEVARYEVLGNTLLTPGTIGQVLTNVDGAFGTNVSLAAIQSVVIKLQEAYSARGYVTVAVSLPRQDLTNATVKVQVTEGRLAAINVQGNHYFSSNNVMSALPGLHTNLILNALVFQAALNQANANQDRKIYPVIRPGPGPGTSELTLNVKDRTPAHAKVELNNDSSPGTPDLRVNFSAVYDNLWQQEQSVGVQYGFSPELYKKGVEWNFYDQPLVANYSGFYRIPLGGPVSIVDLVAEHPGSFGYNEATRKFNLPPPSGQPDLTFFASRSTLDTGVQTVSGSTLYSVPGVETITANTVQQDLTVNNDLAVRLSAPLAARGNFHSDFSGGLDFKTYRITSVKTNNFISDQITVGLSGEPNPPIISTVASPVPTTARSLNYLPVSGRYSASWHDSLGLNTFGLGLGGNFWYSGSRTNLRNIANSPHATGHWVVLNPGYVRSLEVFTNWVTWLRADGQWASEPLIANEEFGIGGVNSVRGYQAGQVFGDEGWHVSLEQQTPPQVVGSLNGGAPLIFRGSVYMDYAETYLLDPQGRAPSTALWGTGFGIVASLGSCWESRFLFSLPLLKSPANGAYAPFFNFSLTAQF